METNSGVQFRSLLQHEPPLPRNIRGYLQIQGPLVPKLKAEESDDGDDSMNKERVAKELLQRFNNLSTVRLLRLELLDSEPPYTKVRLTFDSTTAVERYERLNRDLSPAKLFAGSRSNRPLQITQVTTHPLAEPSWPRSGPPKFRRLIARPGEDSTDLEQERLSTRFVVLTNLVDQDEKESWSNDPKLIARAIRSVLDRFDRSGLGVEVFVPSLLSKRSRFCHVGMRSASDAKAVVTKLQEQVVDWCIGDDGVRIRSGTLFVDYAAITQRSRKGDPTREEKKGEPTRPQCTSTTDHVRVPGLLLVPDFLSDDEEAAILAVLTGPHAPWTPSQRTTSHEASVRRSVQHYGYVFDYQTADVLRDRSIPGADCPPMPALHENGELLDDRIQEDVQEGRGWEVLAGIEERTRLRSFAVDEGELNFPNLNQLTVNHYQPGEGIGSHVDTRSAFGDGLISISLSGGIVMEFRKGTEKKLVYLPPRSLVLMSGDARYQWEHMIVSRMTDTHDGKVLTRKLRVSLTLRTALSEDGSPLPLVESAAFPPVWGNRPLDEHIFTPECERAHVHAVYDAIATQWHHTRGKRGVLWPGATQFIQELPVGSVVADVGCGDGKYFPAIWEAGSFVIGTDISEPLLRTAIRDATHNDEDIPESRRVSPHHHHFCNRPTVAVADCMNLPLRTSSCDAAISIALMHHLSTPRRRRRCIEELVRIVKDGGLVNVQAWSIDQEDSSRHRFAANDVFVPFNAQPKYLTINGKAINKSSGGNSTAQVYAEAHNAEFDDNKGLVVFQRYCHLYRKGELDEIALQVPGVSIVESGFESGNYFIIFQVHKE